MYNDIKDMYFKVVPPQTVEIFCSAGEQGNFCALAQNLSQRCC